MFKRLVKASVVTTVAGGAYINFFADDQTKSNFYGVTHSIANTFRAGYGLGSCIWDYYYTLQGYEYNSDEYHKIRSEIHSRSAKTILWLSEINRGIYLKAGQYIGNLERVMPKEYTEVLKVLQDSGPYIPFEEIRIVVDHDLAKLEDVYESFERIPIAAATLAQVHKAKLKNGPEVAVKLQFPFLKVQTKYDLMVIEWISKFLNQVLKWNSYENIDLVKNFDVFSCALKQELDFRTEVKNAEITRKLFAHDPRVYIPKNYFDYSSERVITQEFVYGAKINDAEGIRKLGLNTVECANLLVDTFSEMIFEHGHIHCDAHPGNILIRNDLKNPARAQLILLDHGFYRNLTTDFRMKFSALWKSLVSFDYDTTREVSNQLGIGEFYKYLPIILMFRTLGSMKKIGETMTKEEREEIRKKDLVNFEKINQLMNALPSDMLFIIRATNLVAIHNGVLGGTTRYRLMKYTELAYQNLYPNVLKRVWEKFKFFIKVMLFEAYPSLFTKFYTFNVD